MTPKQVLSSFSEFLIHDDRILSPPERALLKDLLRNMKMASECRGACQAEIDAVIAAAVGETVAQRAYSILGESVVELILSGNATAEVSENVELRLPTTTLMPGPKPPSPSPGPPGLRKPMPHEHPKHHPHEPTSPAPPSSPTPPGSSQPRPMKSPGPPGSGSGLLPSDGSVIAAATHQSVSLQTIEPVPTACVILDEFLSPEEMRELFDFAVAHEADFRPSEIVSPAGGLVDYEHRRSRVLFEVGAYQDLIFKRIEAVLPQVLHKLGLEPYPISNIETQITASNDGDCFKMHTDDGHGEVAARYLTFVYFVHNEPAAFEGGELRLYEAAHGEQRAKAGSCHAIVPQANQIVFFPCSLLHEVTAVKCSSRAFADSRFTLNGWLHR